MTTDRDWFVKRFFEQMVFMETSVNAFDEGNLSEASRLATSIRVLVHDAKSSTSLLKQLGIKDGLMYASLGSLEETPGWTLEVAGGPLVVMNIVSLGGDSDGFAYLPVEEGDESRVELVEFDQWWSTPALVAGPHSYSRSDLVLVLANKLGGAHVDDLTNKQRALHEGKRSDSYA